MRHEPCRDTGAGECEGDTDTADRRNGLAVGFDFPDISERHGDDIERFRVSVDQLQEGVRLLEAGGTARQRMALVAFDTLAEGLLFRHLDRLFLISDEPYRGKHRTFPATERRRARERFKKRVALANEQFEGVWPFHYPEPILDALDAAVFRVAHHYRNPVYHEDRHHPTLIEPIGRLYAQAVGRAFVRARKPGYAVSCSKARMEEFAALGWDGMSGYFSWGGRSAGYFEPRAAAEAITQRICGHLNVDMRSLATELHEDITYRCDAVDEDIAGLRRDGLSEERVRDFLVDVQDWAANRGDETMLRLQTEHQELEDAAMAKGEFDEATLDSMKKIQHQEWEHLFGATRTRVSRVDLDSHVKIRSASERLGAWKGTLAGLLERYQRLDEELELLEEAMDYMVMQWDRHLQEELDAARGK